MKGSVKLPVFIDAARKVVNTTELRAKYLGATYEAEYCQWQALHGLGALMQTASLIITPNAYLEGKLIASYPPDPIGDFDVTRATTATRVNSAGLVELVPYNLAQYSEQFDNAYWTKLNASITANATTAPNGSLTADKLVENTALNSHRFLSTAIETIASNQYTISIYLKAAERNYAYVRLNNSGGDIATANIDLVNGVVSQSVIGTFVVTSVGNGWFRVNGTGTSASSSNAYIEVRTSNSATYANYTGDGVSGIYTWGAQLNEGALKDYQKTETRLNIPRLDYSNGTCPSILVEPQRTNLNLYSEQFENAAYSSAGGAGSSAIFTANYGLAPDGNITADRVQITRGAIYWERYQRKTTTIGQVYTLSFWGKAVTGTPTLYTAWNTAYQNPVTFTNEWVRYTYTYTAAGTSTGFNLISWVNLPTTSATADIMIWGVQLEQGSYATSYIPTTSASVTRNADVISKTGISSLIGQTEGTLFLDLDFSELETSLSADTLLLLSNGTINNQIGIVLDTTSGNPRKILGLISNGGSYQALIYDSAYTTKTHYKIALAYKANDVVMYINGNLIGTDTSATIPTTSDLSLSKRADGDWFNDCKTLYHSAALWKTRLTNTQLAQLTAL